MDKIREKTTLPKRVETIRNRLDGLAGDIHREDLSDLRNLIMAIEKKCETLK